MLVFGEYESHYERKEALLAFGYFGVGCTNIGNGHVIWLVGWLLELGNTMIPHSS